MGQEDESPPVGIDHHTVQMSDTSEDIIHQTAIDGLDALEHGELTGVKAALESIRDRTA